MPAHRLKYQQPAVWSRETVESALLADDPDALLSAVIAVSMHEEDQQYAQKLCVRLSRHSHFIVRGNAVLGFGHIARVHGKLDYDLVHPIITAALKIQMSMSGARQTELKMTPSISLNGSSQMPNRRSTDNSGSTPEWHLVSARG